MPSVAQKLAVNDDVLDSVRYALQRNAYTPFELMAYLESKHKYSDSAIREAVWKLLSNFEIEFSGDQKLHIRRERCARR